MPQNIHNTKFDKNTIWAIFIFFNVHFFYLAPVKIYFDNNPGGTLLKGAVVLIFFIYALRNIAKLSKYPMISLLIFVAFIHLIFDKSNFINVAMPIIISLALYRVNFRKFVYDYYVVTNIFWVLYLIIFVLFYDTITTYDTWLATRTNLSGSSVSLRGGIGFTSPNNIGGFLSLAAVIAFLARKKYISLLYLFGALLTFLYTDSRSLLVTAFLVLLITLINLKWKQAQKINLLIFYMVVFSLFLLSLFAFFGLLDQFSEIDLILSHRLHYIQIILEPSLFGTTGVFGLDNSFMSLLNKGGVLAFLVYVYVLYKTIKINREAAVLVLSFMFMGLAENVINQYNILGPLIFLIYFQRVKKCQAQEGML